MKKAIVDVPTADYEWFEKLIKHNLWDMEWANDGEEYPDCEDD